MEIGQFVKQYRQKNRLALRKFAEICGVSHSYIAMLENGKNSKTGEPIVPSLSMLKKLSTGMGMSINELISISDDCPVSLNPAEPSLDLQLFAERNTPDELALTEGERLLIELFRQIPEDQQKHFLEIGRAYANSLKKD